MLVKLSSFAMNRPAYWLVACVSLTVILGLGLKHLQIRTEGAALYPTGNKVIQQTDKDHSTFSDPQELILLVTLQDPKGNFLGSPEELLSLKHIHESLKNLEDLHPAGVFSLASIPVGYPRTFTDVRTLLDSIPSEPDSFAALRQRIRDISIVDGLLLSADGDAAAFYVNFDLNRPPRDVIRKLQHWINTQKEKGSGLYILSPSRAGTTTGLDQSPGDIDRGLQSWIETRAKPGYDMHVLSPLAAENTLGEMVLRDLARLIPIMVTVIALLLMFCLRTLGGVVLPMVLALMVLICIFGAMGFCGVPVTLVTTVLPVVLMTMGITDQIHLLERFQSHLATSGRAGPGERKREAMRASLRNVGWPIIATSLTTALAFLSFLSASIGPVRQFGLFASLGILLAMLFTFTFIPALAVMLPVSWFTPRKAKKTAGTGFGTLFFWEKGAAKQRSRAWLIGVLLVVAGVPGIRLLSVQDAWVDNFDPDSPLPLADQRYNDEFWGSYRYDVVLESDRGFFYSPEGVRLVEEFTRIAEGGPRVGGVLDYLDAYWEVAHVYGFPRPLSALPGSTIRSLAAGARFGLGEAFLRTLVQPEGSSVRVRVFVNNASYMHGLALEEYIEARLRDLTERHDVNYHFSGDLPAAVEVVRAIVTNQLRSIGWTLLGIAVLLLLALRKVVGTLIVLVPVLAADWILFAGLGYAGVPLGIATSMFASLTIGVGIDYALHLRYSYRHHIATEQDHESALVKALGSTGRAIRWNAFALGIGFLVLGFSSIPPNRALGILLSAAMVTCYTTTLLLLPRLLRFEPISGSSH